MKFVNNKVYQEWQDDKLHPAVRQAGLIVDSVVKTYYHFKDKRQELYCTSLYRPDCPNSYHSKWQAFDCDLNNTSDDWPDSLKRLVTSILVMLRVVVSYHIQHQFHSSPNFHLHIEYDDDSLKKGQ